MSQDITPVEVIVLHDVTDALAVLTEIRAARHLTLKAIAHHVNRRIATVCRNLNGTTPVSFETAFDVVHLLGFHLALVPNTVTVDCPARLVILPPRVIVRVYVRNPSE